MITAETWYDPNPDNSLWYQGDVVKDIPYPLWPQLNTANQATAWGILRPWEQSGREPVKTTQQAMKKLPIRLIARTAADTTDLWELPEGEYMVAACRKMNVMIISRSCSLDKPERKHFLIAPVTSLEELPEPQKHQDRLADLTANKIPHLFYLPAYKELQESFADLLRLVPIHRTFFEPKTSENIAKSRLAKLSSIGTAELELTLSAHFGRKFGFDYKDNCPQRAVYACSNCFYSGQPTEKKTFEAGAQFGPCDRCGEKATWVKMP